MIITNDEIKLFLKKLSFDDDYIEEFIEQINYFEGEAKIRDDIVKSYLNDECIEVITNEIVYELLKLDKTKLTILDVAAGSGFFTKRIKNKLEKKGLKVELFGLDITQSMLKNLRQKGIFSVWGVAEKIKKSIEIFNEHYKTDVPEKFDAVFSTLAFHHFLQPEKVLSSMKEVLIEDGKIIIVDVLKHDYEEFSETLKDTHLGFSKEEINSMGSKLFAKVKVEQLGAYCRVDDKKVHLYKAVFE
ncbi:class I SAM-dependent methyltransferase [Thermosipho ferrireducens]|uniref:Class I SAM-dependent methyltransferase n=1 Tax=Thermosipho ferrireducens TaxID=2571116 RepID=A0ABX7S669_9BACT|nr:class I SAM-dependent methyltransferase [Thermosipho ferrireducens]QTA37679.1 class I SAM-dependent methyltransferase [Thermosipho ferrireducens]